MPSRTRGAVGATRLSTEGRPRRPQVRRQELPAVSSELGAKMRSRVDVRGPGRRMWRGSESAGAPRRTSLSGSQGDRVTPDAAGDLPRSTSSSESLEPPPGRGPSQACVSFNWCPRKLERTAQELHPRRRARRCPKHAMRPPFRGSRREESHCIIRARALICTSAANLNARLGRLPRAMRPETPAKPPLWKPQVQGRAKRTWCSACCRDVVKRPNRQQARRNQADKCRGERGSSKILPRRGSGAKAPPGGLGSRARRRFPWMALYRKRHHQKLLNPPLSRGSTPPC